MVGLFSSEVQDGQSKRFHTYFKYLTAIKDYLESAEYQTTTFILPVIQSPKFTAITNTHKTDLDKLGRLLRNAWSTELQINLAGENPGYCAYTNHWTPVQTYYSIYLALRAYIHTNSPEVDGEHARNLHYISEQIRSRPELFPYPWKMLCAHSSDGKSIIYHHCPSNIVISTISPLSSLHRSDFWDWYGMFLRTTRERQIQKHIDDWKQINNKDRVSVKTKAEHQRKLAPTSLFHGLYRLRLRSNYGDADSFWMASPSDYEAENFHKALESITWGSLLIFELLIARHIGKRVFSSIVDGFIKHDKNNLTKNLVVRRWETIKPLW